MDFDLLDTVAGRQIWDEAEEKGKYDGLLEEAQQMVACAMQTKYFYDFLSARKVIQEIKDREVLRNLIKEIILCDDFSKFKQQLDDICKAKK